MKKKLITTYEIIENEIHITSPYCSNVIQSCKRWGGEWDAEKLVWVVPLDKLNYVQKHLGDQSKPLVRVQVSHNEYKGSQYLSMGLYPLASRRERDSPVTVHADKIYGDFPLSGGSRRFPTVNSPKAVFTLWVPTDFANKKSLKII